ncbi:CHAT domain-containing protein [Microbacterium sp. M28]|uniref:CHAT domain-containing protein n=1 Tax=Microbacterium sp. M28 TaxID=2962064 RepID=UPI0021F4A1FF|nr:CHAT domain-containing protein [Microbacterium sp. M28]UYO96949.1 CHAT domain-containing protein [Microbacterium sp. M28]
MGSSGWDLWQRGRAALDAQRFTQARRLLDRAAAAPDADADLQARVAGTLSYVLAQTGDPAGGESLVREALARDGLTPETAAVLAGQLGVICTRAGRLDEAEVMLTRAVDGLTGVALANCLMNRSLVHMQRRDLDACAIDLQRATEIYESAGEASAAAEARHNLGYAALLAGDLVTALDLMARSRPVIAAESDVSAAMSDLDRAEVLRDAGLVEEAERLLESVAVVFGAARMRQARAEAEFHLARSLLQHDPTRAVKVAGAAARRFRALGSESWAARSAAVRLDAKVASGSPPRAEEFIDAAAALTAAGFPTEATAVRLSGAVAAARTGQGQAPLPRLPRQAPTPLKLRAAEARAARSRGTAARRHVAAGLDLLSDWQRSFGALDLQASVAMHGTNLIFHGLRSAAESGDPSILFDWSERARHLSQQVVPVRPPHDPELASDLAELRMLRAELTGSEWTTHPQVRALRDRVRERQWTATGAGDTRRRVGIDEVRAVLEPGTAVLSYVFTGSELLCVVTTTADGRIVRLRWADVERATQGLRADLDVAAAVRSGPMAAVVARALDERMQSLGAALLEPALAVAEGALRLILTVPGALGGIPWGMLPQMAGLPFVLATSVSRWFDDRSGGRRPASAGFAAGPRVPRAEEETRAAASAWQDATVLAESDARVDAVTTLADRVDVLHIAAHGRHTVDNPLFAGFELHDGTLFGYDVDLIPRVPDTVVLSACELGRSSVRWGEEALGMTRVWLHAGTRAVIAAPTVVADDVASELLAAVHTGLSAGEDPAVALAAASSTTGLRTPFQVHGTAL